MILAMQACKKTTSLELARVFSLFRLFGEVCPGFDEEQAAGDGEEISRWRWRADVKQQHKHTAMTAAHAAPRAAYAFDVQRSDHTDFARKSTSMMLWGFHLCKHVNSQGWRHVV